MRFFLLTILAALGLGLGGAAAQSRADMERCRAITDDARRLDCYDAIELSIGGPVTKYEALELSELKSFALSYRGDLVEVSGWLVPGPSFFKLGEDAEDPRPIPVDFGSVPRRDRQAFLAACGEGCEATVQGRVRPVDFTTGIVADTIIAR